jgi:hypothetical protein
MTLAQTLFDTLLLGSVPAYPIVQLVAWYRLHGGWRLASTLPLLSMCPALLISGLMFVQGSDHWPMFLIIASPPSVLYLLLVLFFGERRQRIERAYYERPH